MGTVSSLTCLPQSLACTHSDVMNIFTQNAEGGHDYAVLTDPEGVAVSSMCIMANKKRARAGPEDVGTSPLPNKKPRSSLEGGLN